MILFRKMLRDIRLQKEPCIAIFLMMFLGAFVFSGFGSEWMGMQKSAQQFYKETNMADVWVYGKSFQKQDVKRVKQERAIQDIEERSVVDAQIVGKPKAKLQINVLKENRISKMHVVKGKPYQANQKGLWLDDTFAQENHIHVGDTITITLHGTRITQNVVGRVLSPDEVYASQDGSAIPDHRNNGYAFISAKTLPFTIPYTQLLIKSNAPSSVQGIMDQDMPSSFFVVNTRKEQVSYKTLQDKIKQHQEIGAIFPLIFLLVAVLTTITTVTKMMMSQRTSIGVFKALGFPRRKIQVHYLSHVTLIAALGGLLGYAIGPLVLPAFIYSIMKKLFVLPSWNTSYVLVNFVVILLAILMCFLSGWYVGRKQCMQRTISLFQPVIATHPYKIHVRKHPVKHFYSHYNLRDIRRNKIRTCIAILGIVGCSGLLLCALGLHDSMEHMMDMEFHTLQTFEERVSINQQANVDQIKKMMAGSAIEERQVQIKKKSIIKTGTQRIQEDTRYQALYHDGKVDKTLPKNGIALSYNLAKSLSVHKLDTIAWRTMGSLTWHYGVVSMIYHTPLTQGLVMSVDELQKEHDVFLPNAIVGKTLHNTNVNGVLAKKTLHDMRANVQSLLDSLTSIILMLSLVAILLGFVVLYNMVTMFYMEIQHDMATLKVLGFQSRRLRTLMRQQNLWICALGFVGGVPFGIALVYVILATMEDAMDITIYITGRTIVCCLIASLVVSILSVEIIAKRITKLDMAQALKAMD